MGGFVESETGYQDERRAQEDKGKAAGQDPEAQYDPLSLFCVGLEAGEREHAEKARSISRVSQRPSRRRAFSPWISCRCCGDRKLACSMRATTSLSPMSKG